jgi:hypothetical protein
MVSDEALKYFKMRKTERGEPLFNVVDRILNEFRHSKEAELIEINERLLMINQIYLNKIHELEADGQLKFVNQ